MHGKDNWVMGGCIILVNCPNCGHRNRGKTNHELLKNWMLNLLSCHKCLRPINSLGVSCPLPKTSVYVKRALSLVRQEGKEPIEGLIYER